MNGNKRQLQNLIIFIVVLVGVVGLLSFFGGQNRKTPTPVNMSDLVQGISQEKVSKVVIGYDGTTQISLYKTDVKNKDDVEVKPGPTYVGTEAQLQKDLAEFAEKTGQKIDQSQLSKVEFQQEKPSFFVRYGGDILNFVLLVVGLVIVIFFFMRMVQNTNNRSISFGSSSAKNYSDVDEKQKVTFTDVAGSEEAKAELVEIVDFLKRPQEYFDMGARIPRGLLMTGSPGVGKTLLARAVAGEAGVPFLYISGSEFVEMFVGVGASRVRDLFKKAKKLSPCIIFIDEIDAVGRQRGTGLGGGNDEREQTLNQILVEMDGFDNQTPIIVIAATNRPDVLDPALLRPGRFDRQIMINLPDKKERLAILKVHAKNKKMAEDVNLEIVAQRTPGFSGADLMNVLNEGAILAVRSRLKSVTNNILREAIEKVVLGPSLVSKVVTPEDKKLTAYHEAGHALAATMIPEADKVQKITIIPRGRAGGYNFFDKQDKLSKTRSEFVADIAVMYGGYVTEQIVFGQMSTGASNDLQQATGTARKMVIKYGMSDLGPVSFDEERGMSFVGKEMMYDSRNFSEDTARKIDEEVSKILKEGYDLCRKVISENRQYLDRIANALMDQEVLEYEEFMDLMYDALLPADREKYEAEKVRQAEEMKDKKHHSKDKDDHAPGGHKPTLQPA
ncbi:MAG: ATP-dependent zinc metalloprotease FtsH [Patescibacteria group bacterium]